MLKKITIRNFRSCEDVTLDLDSPIIALIGRNGVGKTNILEATLLLCQTAGSEAMIGLEQFLEGRHVSFDALFEIESRDYEYHIAYDWVTEAGEPTRMLREKLEADCGDGLETVLVRDEEEVTARDKATPIRIGRAVPCMGALASLLPADDPVNATTRPLREYVKSVGYYPLVDLPSESTLINAKEYRAWVQNYRQEGQIEDSIAYRILYMWEYERERFEELRSLVGGSGLGLLEDISVVPIGEPDPANGSAKQTDAEQLGHLIFFSPSSGLGGSGRNLLLSQLSTGTRRILRMLTSLMFDRRSMMLVEQPEDCIHPGLLYKVLDIFRSYSDRCHFIFSSHSLEVFNNVRPEEVRLVTAPEGKTQVRGLTPGEIESANDYLKEDGSLADFLGTMEED
jgi:energy-coupling factor transporter ATP-binding protein EcfA2